jgi:hypothetical protein
MSPTPAPTSLSLDDMVPYAIDTSQPFNDYNQLKAPLLEYELLAILDETFRNQDKYSTATLYNAAGMNPIVMKGKATTCDEIVRGSGGGTSINLFAGGASHSDTLSNSVIQNQRLIQNQTVAKSDEDAPSRTIVQGKILVRNERLNQGEGHTILQNTNSTLVTIPAPVRRKCSVKKDTRSIMV